MSMSAEQRAEEDAVLRYEAEGYRVVREPDLSTVLTGSSKALLSKKYRVDFIAERDGETRIVQVVRRGDAGVRQIDKLAEAVRFLDDVQLDVVWLGRVDDSVPDEGWIQEFARQGIDLAETAPMAGFLIGCAALEGGLRVLREHLNLPQSENGKLSARDLYTRGVITSTTHTMLNQIFDARNILAHSGQPVELDKAIARYPADMALNICYGGFQTPERQIMNLTKALSIDELRRLARWSPGVSVDPILVDKAVEAASAIYLEELSELAGLTLAAIEDRSGDKGQ